MGSPLDAVSQPLAEARQIEIDLKKKYSVAEEITHGVLIGQLQFSAQKLVDLITIRSEQLRRRAEIDEKLEQIELAKLELYEEDQHWGTF
jgi:hypothetical protein